MDLRFWSSVVAPRAPLSHNFCPEQSIFHTLLFTMKFSIAVLALASTCVYAGKPQLSVSSNSLCRPILN
jgi:hypothetical protein